jgi:hypothetical protein
LSDEEIAAVPLVWRGDLGLASGFIRPREAPLEVSKFEKYLRQHKIAIEAGGKHPHFRIGDRKCPYPKSKGSGKKVLPHAVLSSVCDTLGFRNPAQLRDAVRRGSPPPALSPTAAA